MEGKKFYNAYPAWILPEKPYKITGWVSRSHSYGSLILPQDKPERNDYANTVMCWYLDDNFFPDLKCEDEPTEVELTLRKKTSDRI